MMWISSSARRVTVACVTRSATRGLCFMTPTDERRFESILRSIDLILEYAAGPDWAGDQRTVDAIAKRLEDIGEQAGRLSEEALASLSGVPWRDVIGMRARIVHDTTSSTSTSPRARSARICLPCGRPSAATSAGDRISYSSLQMPRPAARASDSASSRSSEYLVSGG